MNVTIEQQTGCIRTLTVDVPHAELQPEIDKAYRTYRKKVKLEGFRKGKAPLHLIKKLFGDAIEAEALDTAMKILYPKALEDAAIKPVNEGSIEDITFEPGQDLQFRVRVEVEPEILLDNLAGLSVKKQIRTIRDENVDTTLEQFRFQHATKESVEDAAEYGHFLTADVQQLDPATGLAMIGNKWDNQYWELGKDALGPGVDAQLLGVKVGDATRVIRKYPADYEDSNLAGKEEHYQITVQKIDKITPPDLDDAFAKDLGQGLETMAALRERIRTQLEQQAQQEGEEHLRHTLMTEVLQRHEFDLPPKMVANVLHSQMEEAKRRSQEPLDDAMLRERLTPVATRSIKWYWLRKKLAAGQNLHVTDPEIEERITTMAQGSTMTPEQSNQIFGSPEFRERVADDLLEAHVFNYLQSIASVEEIWV